MNGVYLNPFIEIKLQDVPLFCTRKIFCRLCCEREIVEGTHTRTLQRGFFEHLGTLNQWCSLVQNLMQDCRVISMRSTLPNTTPRCLAVIEPQLGFSCRLS